MVARPAALLLAVCWLAASPATAEPYRLAPFKDDLFAYKKILDSAYDGDMLLVEYNRQRDLVQRDVVERLRVDPKYVSLETEAVEAELSLDANGRRVRYVAVGKTDSEVKAIVIFLHGNGADREAGANDWIHGGNFSRIKNLMMRNDGLYISADFADFGRRGTADVKALLLHYANQSPEAAVFLGCASWGGRICWRLLDDPETAPRITGLVFLDSQMDDDFIRKAPSLAPSERPAIHISNNAGDWIVGHKAQVDFFRRLKAAAPDYPAHFVLFSGGIHGISLRMTDWRETLNWMLEVKGR